MGDSVGLSHFLKDVVVLQNVFTKLIVSLKKTEYNSQVNTVNVGAHYRDIYFSVVLLLNKPGKLKMP